MSEIDREREVPWQSLFALAPVPMGVLDAAGHLVASNDAFRALLGRAAAEAEPLDLDRFTRPEDQAWIRRYLDRLLSGDTEWFETEQYVVRPDGRHVLTRVSCRAFGADSATPTHVVAAMTELSDELRLLEPGIADRLLEFGRETVTLVDESGEVRTRREGQMQGHPTTLWRGREISELLAPGEFERLTAFREEVAAEPGSMIEVDVDVMTVDGETRTIATRVFNCLDDPLLGGFVIVTRDITGERAVVAELAARRRTAEAVVDTQTRLLATVSHELRNPLHAAHGIAELLAAEDLSADAAELAGSLVRQLASLARVTQDLLDAARLEAGSIVVEPVPTDLQALIGDVVGFGRAACAGRPLTVTSRIAPDVPRWVSVDPDRLRQVLTNLVGNAVRFTQRGAVQVGVRVDGGGRVVFSVVDSGVGIPADEQRMILEPFAVASTAGTERGAGLGLSVVARLVDAMEGSLSLQSTVGRGTRIDVALPLAECAPPPTAEPAPAPIGLHVLVIEDNPVNQQLAARQLERLGFEATVVGSGEDGFELVAADPSAFDVLLMDQQLPGWSGVETTLRIRGLGGEAAALPIIGVSASATLTDRTTFLDAGMDDLVAKPATLLDLSDAIARLRPGERSSDERLGDAATMDSATTDTVTMDARTIDAPRGHALAASGAVDGDVLARLSAEVGDGVTRGIVATFLDELPGRLDAVAAAPDVDVARRAAHTLKSTARLVGATELADLCQQIERGSGDPTRLGAAATKVVSELGAWQRRHGG